MKKDYRVNASKAETLTPFGIIHEFVFAIDGDIPPIQDTEARREFLSNLNHIDLCLYSAYFAADTIVQGGEWLIFENLCGYIIIHAIEGFQMFGESVAANKLIEACKFFPENLDSVDPSLFLDKNRDAWFKFIAHHDTKIQIQTIINFWRNGNRWGVEKLKNCG